MTILIDILYHQLRDKVIINCDNGRNKIQKYRDFMNGKGLKHPAMKNSNHKENDWNKTFSITSKLFKMNELHKDDLKDLKTNTINKIISIPEYKFTLRKNTTDSPHIFTLIETKN
ncbi:MAG: hypothetical protein Ta2E_01870 [Mycoplasmoidaceae bacterium]|nr:MAG: hypothetical protein Ta2E_01870 [Mycoplasmoidaceae bacterium]